MQNNKIFVFQESYYKLRTNLNNPAFQGHAIHPVGFADEMHIYFIR